MGEPSQTSSVISVTLPAHRVEQAARDATRRALAPFCLALASYYLFLTAFHIGFGSDRAWEVLAGCCLASAALLTGLGMLFRRSTPPREQVYAWMVLLVCLVLGNITLFQVISGEPRNFVNYAMVNIAAGLLVLSQPMLLGILVVNFAAWLMAEILNGQGNPMFDGGFLLGTWVLAGGASLTRMGMLERSEAMRLHTEIALDRAERRLEQRDRAIDAHRRSQAGLRRLIELSPQCVVIVQAGAVVFVNQAFRDLIGIRRQALVGRTLQDLVHPEDVDLANIDLLEQESELGVELRFVTGQGETIPLDVSTAPMEYGEGPATLLILHDDRSLDTPDRQALANRMLAVGTMAAGVAHEINNPLAYTIANLEMLGLELGDGEHKDLVDVALEGAARVKDIVADLRRFSREDEESLAPVDVEELLQMAIRMSWNEIRHRARLEREYGDTPRVMANSSRLGQVFLNLLLNAAQSMGDGDASKQLITVRTLVEGDDVVVEFEDTGEGISPAIREQIFRPFFTTKPVGVGTGLGLPYCRNVVEDLGGTIGVLSTVGQGTTFRVALPSCPTDATPVGVVAPERSRMGPPRKILLIDDEAPLAEAIAAVLGSDDVVVASSGEEALKLLDRHWDAVLCDVMMPEMSGPEVYRRIVAARPDLAERIAFVTGGTFTEVTRGFLEETTAPILTKPFRARAIRELVDQLVKL